MPLTIAHPAIVVPLRRWFVLSALVVGSMTPDFSKILSLSPAVSVGHSVSGVFWFCVPMGLAALFLFHGLLKKPLFLFLPESHQARLLPWMDRFHFRTPAQWGLVMLSLVLGALSHLFWDAFTHQHGWFAERIAFLQSGLFEFRGHSVKVYKVLQHGSTIVGMLFLGWCYFWFFRTAPVHSLDSIPVVSPKIKIGLGLFAVVATIVPAMIFAFVQADAHSRIGWIKTFAGRTAVASMAIFCLELVLFGVVCRLWLRHLPTSRPK